MTEQHARQDGYTVAVIASASHIDLDLLVKPDTDYDTDFVAFCRDTDQLITVYGYLFEVDAV